MNGLVPNSTKEVGWGVKLHQYTKIDLKIMIGSEVECENLTFTTVL